METDSGEEGEGEASKSRLQVGQSGFLVASVRKSNPNLLKPSKGIYLLLEIDIPDTGIASEFLNPGALAKALGPILLVSSGSDECCCVDFWLRASQVL